jgi:hypothetical protein
MPQGYCTIVEVPISFIAERLVSKNCIVDVKFEYFVNAKKNQINEFSLNFKNFQYTGNKKVSFYMCANETSKSHCGYIELNIKSSNGENIFSSRKIFGNYITFFQKEKKSFFMNYAYKVGDPQIINQMARFKRFVITYPAVNINIKAGQSNTLLLINPYKKSIVVSFITSNYKTLPRKKIPPHEAIYYPLDSTVLDDEEYSWQGHIQLTANNRLVTYIINHKTGDIKHISNVEHLDPFRDDPTHQRVLQKIRNFIGGHVKREYGRLRMLLRN